MSHYRRTVSQVGKPVHKIKNKYVILQSTKRGGSYYGLIERTRMIDGQQHFAYTIIMSDKPILAHGTMIRHSLALANPCSKKHEVYGRDPEAWFGVRSTAEIYYKKAVRRSHKRKASRKRSGHGSRS